MDKFKRLLILVFISTSCSALAGVFELGASATFRNSKIDSNNYTETQSYTGSISYYFWEMSAIEISFTDGVSILGTQDTSNDPIIYKSKFNMVGADFVFTFSGRQAPFQPYVKAGAAQISKQVFRELNDGSVTKISDTGSGNVVPSAGIGFKMRLTNTLSFKASYDTWSSSSSGDSSELDQAWRIGLSWFL